MVKRQKWLPNPLFFHIFTTITPFASLQEVCNVLPGDWTDRDTKVFCVLKNCCSFFVHSAPTLFVCVCTGSGTSPCPKSQPKSPRTWHSACACAKFTTPVCTWGVRWRPTQKTNSAGLPWCDYLTRRLIPSNFWTVAQSFSIRNSCRCCLNRWHSTNPTSPAKCSRTG